MKKRFIVCVDNPTNPQSVEFVEWLNSFKVGWWHWLNNVWLISDVNGKLTETEIRDKAMALFTGQNLIVLRIDQTTDSWAGFGPNNGEKNMFPWLKDYWKK
ncbi:MAG TPA: hypothetical protein VN922_12390 [Bacteroidia bacterium]|nr:hypothetical protein [Bacteroidia bacterium]